MLVVIASMALFMALHVATAAGKHWYLLALGMLVAMASVFVLTYRWGARRYATRTAEQLNARMPENKPWWISLFSGLGLMVYNAGGPALLGTVFLAPFFFSFLFAVILLYYRRLAV